MIESFSSKALNIACIGHGAVVEYFITAQPSEITNPELLLSELANFLNEHQAHLINLRVFSRPEFYKKITTSGNNILQQLNCPVTWLSQESNGKAYPITLHAHAVSGTDVSTIEYNGQQVGRTFEDDDAQYYHLCLVPENLAVDNQSQAREMFDRVDEILCSVGLDFSATVRTWLFAHDILSWYDKLNEVRDTFFTEHGIFDKLVPASTGIGVSNHCGGDIVAEALAVQPLNDQVTAGKVVSPMQCEALDYKSSFSRATLIDAPDHHRMYVSGTASIAPAGDTVHLDDTAKQIELTMQVAEALIKNGGMDWKDTVRALTYFKDNSEFGLFDEYCKSAGISLPHIKIHADVCRDDLLFEIELDLLAKR